MSGWLPRTKPAGSSRTSVPFGGTPCRVVRSTVNAEAAPASLLLSTAPRLVMSRRRTSMSTLVPRSSKPPPSALLLSVSTAKRPMLYTSTKGARSPDRSSPTRVPAASAAVVLARRRCRTCVSPPTIRTVGPPSTRERFPATKIRSPPDASVPAVPSGYLSAPGVSASASSVRWMSLMSKPSGSSSLSWPPAGSGAPSVKASCTPSSERT